MTSFGDELRRERELRGVSLREVAEATKINRRFLEALERNDFETLHGGLYNRGLVRAYCEVIGVDPESMVNAYLLEERMRSGQEGTAAPGLIRGRAEWDSVVEPPRAAADRALGRWLVWALIVAALVASIFLYIRLTGGGAGDPVDVEPATTERPLGEAGGVGG